MHFPKVLVLGATGRIGGVLRDCWSAGPVLWQGRRVPDDGLNWSVLDLLQEPKTLAQAARGREVILCLSGVVPGAGGNMADNITLAEAAVRAGAAAGARVLLASSAAVYGATPGVLTEATPPAPLTGYGLAKAEMEARAAELGHELSVPVTSLRIGNIAGLDAILGNWKRDFRLDRFDDGRSPRRSYIGMITLARVLGDLLAVSDLPPVLNVASPGVLEMGALLDAAGLEWTPQPAGKDAIVEVRLSTALLQRYTRFDPAEGEAATMVAQWRQLQKAGTA